MQVTIEATQGLARKMRVLVPSEQLDSQVDREIQTRAKSIKIKGFRPGKVPPREVKRRFGKEIRQDVAARIMQASFDEAIAEQHLTPASSPQIEEITNETGQDFEFRATFDVFPTIKVAPFKHIAVKRQVSQVEAADIDKMIEILRKQHTEYVVQDRPCRATDRVKIDFEGLVDGVEFAGNQARGQELILGAGSMLPGFEEAMMGMQPGAEQTIVLDFPETHQNKELAGKPVTFQITLHEVAAPRLPGLNADFYKAFDVPDGSLETFQAEVRANMERQLDLSSREKVKEEVLEALCSVNKFELPAGLMEQEMHRMRELALQRYSINPEQLDSDKIPAELFIDQAKRRLKVGLLLTAIAKKHAMQADPTKVDERIATEASSYEKPEEVISYIKNNTQEHARICNLVLEDQIVDLILESARVQEVPVDYETAVTPAGVKDEPEPE